MKRLSLFLTILVTMLHAHLHAATFTASQIEIIPGQTAQLVIGMNNTETNLSGFQFKLYLPEGLSVTTNDQGEFVYTKSGRIANHAIEFRSLNDGGYLVIAYSMNADVITGSSGELMSISVTADEAASATENGTLSNIRVTDVSSNTSSCNDVPIDVILSNFLLTLTASGNGAITYGNTSVRSSSQKFGIAELSEVVLTVTPDAGHHVETLLVNDEDALSQLTADGKLIVDLTVPDSVDAKEALSLLPGDDKLDFLSATSSVSVAVTFAVNVHDVTFKYGETVYLHEQVAYGAAVPVPDDPTLKGHTFAGWMPDVPETMPDEDLSFTAQFTVNQYKATFTIPSEDWTEVLTLDYGSVITAPTPPEKPGYAFAGWDNPIPETMPDEDLVFTGSYTQNMQVLTITAAGNGVVSYGNTSVRASSQSFDVAELSEVVLTITPDAGYHVETLTINGEDALSQLTDGKLSIGSITSSVTVAVTFATNVIDFADANVKAICVANWDTNGDGELDEAEAAAVTDLGTVFRNNETITSFNELQYFTGLTSIGVSAFYCCTNLTSVIIPESVTSIDACAFEGCHGMKSITIPESVTSIGVYGFDYCEGLTSITIPKSVIGIGVGAFEGCHRLTSIKVKEGNTVYDSRNNCNAIIETKSNTLVAGCMNTVIPYSVTSIGDKAFCFCFSLTSITIPESVTSIGGEAFAWCHGPTSVTIPKSVTSIGDGAFEGCEGLTSIKVEEGNTVYDSRDNCNAIIETKSNTLIAGCKNTVIPNSVTNIGNAAFGGCFGLTAIIIPESVTSIGYSAFYHCIGLTSIAIPGSVTSIGGNAFGLCDGLTSVTIPGSVTSIGSEAFRYCSSLTEVYCYAKQVPSTANNAFFNANIEDATLYVPKGSVELYKAASPWSGFGTIVPLEGEFEIPVEIPNDLEIEKYAYTAYNYFGANDNPEEVSGNLNIGIYGEDIYIQGMSTDYPNAWIKGRFEDETTVVFPSGQLLTDKTNLYFIAVNDNFDVSDQYTLIYNPESGVFEEGSEFPMVNSYKDKIDNSVWQFYYDYVIKPITVNPSTHTLTLTAYGNGVVSYANTNVRSSSQSFDVAEQSEVVLTVTPDAGYHVETLTINGEDALSQLTDGKLSIGSITASVTIAVTFAVNVIDFADANVKAICVANWDTNGDGELSESEAAAVKSLNKVFKGNNEITSFDEFKYFTGVTSLGFEEFENCSNLASISLPNSLTSCSQCVFNGCTRLSSINWPKNEEFRLSYGMFQNCDSITYITLPSNVIMAGGVFIQCYNLKEIKVDDANPYYQSIDGVVYSKDMKTIIAYPNGKELTEYTIPDGIETIGESAFECSCKLDKINIPTSVGTLGRSCFDSTNIKSLIIPQGITEIPNYCCSWCYDLSSVTIPESVTSIGNYAFAGSSSLTSVTIPASVTSIGDRAFGYRNSLKYFYCNVEQVPNTNSDAFFDTNITETTLYVPKGSVESYKAASPWSGFGTIVAIPSNDVIDFADANVKAICVANWDTNGDGELDEAEASVVTNIGTVFSENKTITFFNELQYFTGLTSIGGVAFYNCSGLTSITIPESVTTIGNSAFGNCTGLTSITIPESVTSIGDNAFGNCTGLTSITIPESVVNIGMVAFYECNGLTSITIPNNVASIGEAAFSGCSGLTSIKVDAGNTVYDSRNNCNAIIETNSNTLLAGCVNTVIPNSVTSIGESAFYKCSGMTSITIPESVTSIGNNAFCNCTGLTSITIPESVTSIGNNAFGSCSGLTSITIPSSVTSIGTEAFFHCTSLTEVYCYAEQVPSTGSNAFSDTNIKDATLYVPKGSVESYKAASPWSGFGTIVAIPGTTIEEAKVGNLWYAFDTETKQATVIASKDDEYSGDIVIPASVQYQDETYDVTEIDADAFNGCSGLTAVTIPNTVTRLPRFCFWNCDNLTTVTLDCGAIISKTYVGSSPREFVRLFGDQVKECIIGNSVTYIGNFFMDCSSIESITIGSSVKEIRFDAFRGCDLVSITVNAENSTYDSRDNCNAIIDTNNNILVRGSRNTIIPSSVKSIDARAFYRCSLTSITIPSSVTLISTEAFYGCSGLTNITSHIKEPFAIADNVFNGVPYETATLHVPAGTVDAYRATDGWKNFQNIEVIPQQLTIAVVGDGTVTFSGETLTKTTATFMVSDDVQLLLTPDEGCHIERVMVNQLDRTSDVTDGVLTLNVVGEDYFVLVEFQHDTVEEPEYVTYTIYIDGPGDVRVNGEELPGSEPTVLVPKGGDLVIEFVPDEGQMVGKVTWNDETVTEQALGNTLVVRDVQEDGTVSVIFMERMETFVYAGIRYGVTDDIHHIVKVLPYDYSGHLSVPESFDYSQRTWQVQEIGNLAFSNSDWLVSVKIPASIVQTGKNLFKRDTRLAAILWDAQLPMRTEVTGELTNANMLYYVKDKSYAPQGGNVIENGVADNIILSDGHDFYCPEAFKAKKIAYNHIYKMLTRRGYCQGWEALVLPFDVATIRLSRNPDNPEIFPYESLTDDDVDNGEALPFWLYNYNDNDTFTPAASIEANTPYIISMPNDAAYLPMFRLAGNVTFSAQSEAGVDVQCTTDENLQTPGTQRRFQPSYQRKVMGNDCLLVNVNDSVNHQFAEGSMFVRALRPSRPFEAYMVLQTASVKPWYGIFEQMSTDIQDVRIGKNESADDAVYDLSGRKLSNGRLSNRQMPSGIYIIDHKKRVIK